MAKKQETVTIPKQLYDQLIDAQYKLDCLECCGVDNWGGWDDAMEMYHNNEENEE